LDKELAKILERHRIKRFIGSRDFEIARCFSRPLKGLLNLVSAFPPLEGIPRHPALRRMSLVFRAEAT
jgi:hypothetical protein